MLSKNIGYIEKLDHLRFLAAAVVLLFHTQLALAAKTGYADLVSIPLIDQGHTAVPLFMVLSGLILGLICSGRELMTGSFYLNRVLRIYPLFAFVITLGYFSTDDPRPTSTGVEYLLSLLPISNLYRLQFGPFGGHLWSIPVELQFYLLFPFLLLFKKRYGTVYLVRLIAFMVVLRVLIFALNKNVHEFTYFSIFGNLEIFLIGMLLADVYRSERLWREDGWLMRAWRHPLFLLACVFLVQGAIALAFASPKFFHVDGHGGSSSSRLWIFWPLLQAGMWGFLTLTYLRSSWTPGERVSRWLARLGAYSYSMYAWHYLIILLAGDRDGLLARCSPYGLGLFVVLPATILLSAVSYHLIERPFLEMRVRYLKDRPSVAEPPATHFVPAPKGVYHADSYQGVKT